MLNDIFAQDDSNPLEDLNEKIKETTELTKKSLEKLNNYSLDASSTNIENPSSKILFLIKEQKQINRNITQNINYISQKIQLIQDSIIGDPNNLSQVGTILDRLTQLERNVLSDPSVWPSLQILTSKPIITQEENISHNLLTLLYAMVDYAKVNSNYKQMKFPLNSNLGESHLRFERKYHNIKFLCRNAIGIINPEFLQSVLLIASHLYFGLILSSCLEIGVAENIKIIKHRKSFDDIKKIYSPTIEIIFQKCPFKVKPGVKEFFLSLPFPGYYKDDENE